MSRKIVVKGYQVGRRLDQTGFRTVYQGLRIKTGKPCSITIVAVRPGASLNALMRRAGQSQQLNVKGLVTAIDFGVLPDQQFYYTSQAVTAYPIMDVVNGLVDEEERCFTIGRLMLELLDIVGYIHEAGTTHRDLTSAQVRIDGKEALFLEGFINARPRIEPRHIAQIVDLPYMAPEQLKGMPSDKKTDIYSLGVMLFEWLVGKLPFQSNYSKIECYRTDDLPFPSQHRMGISRELEAIVMKALASRGERYSTAQQMRGDLEAFYGNRSLRLKLRDLSAALKRLLVTEKAS